MAIAKLHKFTHGFVIRLDEPEGKAAKDEVLTWLFEHGSRHPDGDGHNVYWHDAGVEMLVVFEPRRALDDEIEFRLRFC